jgi:type II secretory pathway pseudopilin PulG
LVVVTIIGVLATLVIFVVAPKWQEKARFARAVSELPAIANAVSTYTERNSDYPGAVSSGLPANIISLMKRSSAVSALPNGPWPGSTYNWANWPADDQGNAQTYEITLTFCNAGDTTTCKKNFPKQSWVTSSWDSSSTVYFCISGTCRASQNKPVSQPGYCINCGKKEIFN